MGEPNQNATPNSDRSPPESPLSLNRLREAFASMLGQQDSRTKERESGEKRPTAARDTGLQTSVPCDVNPRSVAEAMLFVGRPDNGSMSSRELAAAMRGVSPTEIDAAIGELNAQYDADRRRTTSSNQAAVIGLSCAHSSSGCATSSTAG